MQPASSAGKHNSHVSFDFAPDWLRKWPEIWQPITSKSVQINTMVREANFWVAPRLFLKTRVSPNSLIRKLFFYVRANKTDFRMKAFCWSHFESESFGTRKWLTLCWKPPHIDNVVKMSRVANIQWVLVCWVIII